MVQPKQENRFLTFLFLFIIFTKMCGSTNLKTLKDVNSNGNGQITGGEITNVERVRIRSFWKFSLTGNSESCQSSWCSAPISQLLALVYTFSHVGTSGNVIESLPAREGPSSALFDNSRNIASSSCPDWDALSLRACFTITHPHALFYRPLRDTPDFSSFCSTPPTATPTSMLLSGIRTHPCPSPLQVMQSGYQANSSPHTVCPKIALRRSLFCGHLETWDRITPSNSPRALGTTLKFGNERVHREELCKNVTSVANSVGSKIWGKNTRRNLETRKMSPQRSMGPREKCLQAWNRRKNAYSPAEAWVMPEPSSKSQKRVIDFEASQDKWKLSEDPGTP